MHLKKAVPGPGDLAKLGFNTRPLPKAYLHGLVKQLFLHGLDTSQVLNAQSLEGACPEILVHDTLLILSRDTGTHVILRPLLFSRFG